MPTLKQRTYRQKREKKEYPYKKSKDWAEFYGSRAWKSLRQWKITNQPLCEVCELEGRVKPAEEVHHARVFRSSPTKEGKWELFLSPENLISICSMHHKIAHNYMNKFGLVYASVDDIVNYDVINNNIIPATKKDLP